MIGLFFDKVTGAMFNFLLPNSKIPKYVQAKNRLTHLDWDFMEVG